MMVTLQGVLILRISDFRRFFDWGEFWAKKDDFISLFRGEINRRVESQTKPQEEYYFVDNDAEFYLMQRLYEWLLNPNKELQRIKLDPTELKIETNIGDTKRYSLGRLQGEIENIKKQNQLTSKTIIGYTLLYLLLGANDRKSDVIVEYGEYSTNNKSEVISSIKEYNRCWDNVVLEPTTNIEYPLRRCVFINVNPDKEITIQLGKESVNIEPKNCVIGIFCGNKCYKLLPSTLTGSNNQITLMLKPSLAKNVIQLEIHKPDKVDIVENVVSIGLDSNEQPVYLYANGEIYIEKKNFTLQQQYNGFKKTSEMSKVVALEVIGGYLNIYTEDSIYG